MLNAVRVALRPSPSKALLETPAHSGLLRGQPWEHAERRPDGLSQYQPPSLPTVGFATRKAARRPTPAGVLEARRLAAHGCGMRAGARCLLRGPVGGPSSRSDGTCFPIREPTCEQGHCSLHRSLTRPSKPFPTRHTRQNTERGTCRSRQAKVPPLGLGRDPGTRLQPPPGHRNAGSGAAWSPTRGLVPQRGRRGGVSPGFVTGKGYQVGGKGRVPSPPRNRNAVPGCPVSLPGRSPK